MTWTKRKHSDLVRLLADFTREHPATGAWHDECLRVLRDKRPGRKDEVIRLGWWCDIVLLYYGMERHPAILWYLQQYKGRESSELFRKRFGTGTVDSIARRLYQKYMQYLKSGEAVPLKFDRKDYAAVGAAAKKGEEARWQDYTITDDGKLEPDPATVPQWDWDGWRDANLYRLTFEILPTYAAFEDAFPKPGSPV